MSLVHKFSSSDRVVIMWLETVPGTEEKSLCESEMVYISYYKCTCSSLGQEASHRFAVIHMLQKIIIPLSRSIVLIKCHFCLYY